MMCNWDSSTRLSLSTIVRFAKLALFGAWQGLIIPGLSITKNGSWNPPLPTNSSLLHAMVVDPFVTQVKVNDCPAFTVDRFWGLLYKRIGVSMLPLPIIIIIHVDQWQGINHDFLKLLTNNAFKDKHCMKEQKNWVIFYLQTNNLNRMRVCTATINNNNYYI